ALAATTCRRQRPLSAEPPNKRNCATSPASHRPFVTHPQRIKLSTMARSLDDELEQLFDHSLDAVFIAGLDGYLRRVNRGFARRLGYSHEEFLARPFIDNVHPDDVESVRAAMADLAAGRDLVAFECRQVTADGW